MNQLVNSIAKYKYMYGGLFEVPMLIRAVVGRSWGQGAQHSQSIQAMLSHIPGLTVVMPSSAWSVQRTYEYAVKHYKGPVISFEHRILYDCSFRSLKPKSNASSPFTSFCIRRGKHVTVVATSIMALDALKAASYLEKNYGIELEIIDLNCLTSPDNEMIISSVKKTGRLIVADTGWAPFGVCAEVCRIVAVNAPEALKQPVAQLSMAHCPCPTAKTLENAFYPDTVSIIDAALNMVKGKKRKPHLSESERAGLVDHYSHFRGPF